MTSQARTAFDAVAALLRGWTAFMIAAAGALFCAALVCLIAEVVMRVAGGASIRGLHEIVALIFLYAFFLGAAALYARNEDVALTFFVRSMSERWRAAIAMTVALVVSLCMATVSYESVSLMISQRTIYSADLGISESVRFAPLAIATASIAVTSLMDAWGCLHWILQGRRLAVFERAASAS